MSQPKKVLLVRKTLAELGEVENPWKKAAWVPVVVGGIGLALAAVHYWVTP